VTPRPNLFQPTRRISQTSLSRVGKVSYIRKERCTSMTLTVYVVVLHFDSLRVLNITPKRVFTDANLRNLRVLKIVNNQVDLLLSKAGDAVDTLTYLALELLDQRSGVCNYYFVQHDRRLLFWVQDFDEPMRIYEHVKGVKSDTHISGCRLVLY
jgi:hypothetical protein